MKMEFFNEHSLFITYQFHSNGETRIRNHKTMPKHYTNNAQFLLKFYQLESTQLEPSTQEMYPIITNSLLLYKFMKSWNNQKCKQCSKC